MNNRKKISLANQEFLSRRSRRLEKNGAALAALNSLGTNGKIIKTFCLGLSELYIDTNNTVHENALIAPIMNKNGQPTNQSVYFNIPEVTVNPSSENTWSRGDAQVYFSEACQNQRSVFLCPNIPTLWNLHQLFQQKKSSGIENILFVSSSQLDLIPEDMRDRNFWRSFENIYLADENTNEWKETVRKLVKFTGRGAKRIKLPPKYKNWLGFCDKSAGNAEEFIRLLSEAQPIKAKFSSDFNKLTPGRYGYQPIDIAGAFHNGHLYYPVKTLWNVEEKYRDEHGNSVTNIATRTEVVLIRSDRSIHSVVEIPAPRGTPLDERVLKLTDDTLIESRPKASIHSSWSWKSIQNFKSKKSKTRPLDAILNDVKAFLKASVWLPFDHDYDLLTLLVPVTYAQAIFQAVPLVLVTGPPGSGKSALGKAMVKLCANATTIGQTSAAAIARLIDETKGFVVFDDLEAIGQRKGRDAPQFSELVQALKLSYNKETSWKTWTDVSRGMRVKRLNFFGVKMINNTTGSDDILGSRLFKIHTRKIPFYIDLPSEVNDDFDPIMLNKLRDELHTWTFENVELIDQTYQKLRPLSSDRAAEIAIPLRVFAEISQNTKLQAGLNKALEFQSATIVETQDPVKVMKEAVKNLAISGYSEVSATHILLEMKSLASSSKVYLSNAQTVWNDAGWVGRQLRIHDFVDSNTPPKRQFLYGKYLRIYPLKAVFLQSVHNKHRRDADNSSRHALGFCSNCDSCAYKDLQCEIKLSRSDRKKSN